MTSTARPEVFRRRQLPASLAVLGAIAVLAPTIAGSHSTQFLLNLWLAYAIAAVGFYLVFALAGRFAFCHTFMMALGGYTLAWVTRTHGASAFAAGLVAAMVVTGLVATLIGLCTRRVAGFMFAVVTLAVDEVGRTVFTQAESFTGANGTTVGISPPNLLGRSLATDREIFWLLFATLAAVMVLAVALERSPVRRDALAGNSNQLVARASGVPVGRVQLSLFVLGSALGGLAGGLIAAWNGSVSADSFGLDLAVGLLLMVVLGGTISPWGAVLGAGFYVAAPELLSGLERYQSIVYGGLLLIVVIVLPNGLFGVVRSVSERWHARRDSPVSFTPSEVRDAVG